MFIYESNLKIMYNLDKLTLLYIYKHEKNNKDYVKIHMGNLSYIIYDPAKYDNVLTCEEFMIELVNAMKSNENILIIEDVINKKREEKINNDESN